MRPPKARGKVEAMNINRRTILSLLGASPALLAASAQAADNKKNGKKESGSASPDINQIKLEGLNPRGIPPAIQLVPMAPRLKTLDGKTIYLISDGFPGADHFLNQIAIWFKKNMPSVTTVYRLKAGAFADEDPKLWAEVKEKANGVIMAIGH
jgi:hypothetical protein